ncbi:MAG: formylmethionine deformylase [Candidatus Diapherotrites archaeon CG08_land_8_20_14_0_20_34_12]|nr:MAG: formylmethionine deformylase [Candidatus Diapherotrites archaeon CG08_land_8_20_14_0_20_34_12]
MSIKKILLLGNKILREKSKKVSLRQIDKELITDLKDTLLDFRKREGMGRGVAAPQIGMLKRMIYIITDEFSGIIINPLIINKSKKKIKVWDSCFSLKAAIFCKVLRDREIEVEFFDENGKKQKIVAKDALSELLQHEIDHLGGIMCTDLIKSAKDIIMREEWEKMGRPFLAD